MGFLSKFLGHKAVEVDPSDLKLPEEIPTSQPGLTLRKCHGTLRVDIDIVGESFRAENVEAVARAAAGERFDIDLVAEPGNQYDKNAVAVFAANLHIGYISKDSSKQWAKWVNEALGREELLWGTAKAVTRAGTSNTGVFGSIFMPKVIKTREEILPLQLSDTELQKAIQKLTAFFNQAEQPETLAKLTAQSKKVAALVIPIMAHALAVVGANPEEVFWSETIDLCDEVLECAGESVYASEADGDDVLDTVDALLAHLRQQV